MARDVRPDIPLVVVGCDYRTAGSTLRGELALEGEERLRLASLVRETDPTAGFMVLETCNRVEWLVDTPNPVWFSELMAAQMRERWSRNHLLSQTPEPFHHVEDDAARHILRVVAGLESLAAGEAQIAGQFQRALQLATAEKTASPVLQNLGSVAARVAKVAAHIGYRSNARVGIHGLVASYLDRHLADDRGDVLVVGMGEIGRRTADQIEQRSGRRVIRMNRTVEERHHAIWRPLSELYSTVAAVRAVVVATGAYHPILDLSRVAARGDRRLLVMDIGVPRQVEGQNSSVIDCASIDDLVEFHVDPSKSPLVSRVESEIESEMGRFRRYCLAREVVTLLDSIQQNRTQYLERTVPERVRSTLTDLGESDLTRVESMLRTMIREYSNDIFDSIYGTLNGGAR